MKLKRNDVIVFSPRLTRTIGNPDEGAHYAIGVVMRHDKRGECYDVEVEPMGEFGRLIAVITTGDATRDNLRVIGTL